MGMLEDVMKVLDRMPRWKRVKDLPERFDTLEKRIGELEARLAPATGEQCPACRAMAFKLQPSQQSHAGIHARMGVVQRTYKCSSCGYTEQRADAPPRL